MKADRLKPVNSRVETVDLIVAMLTRMLSSNMLILFLISWYIDKLHVDFKIGMLMLNCNFAWHSDIFPNIVKTLRSGPILDG